MAIRTLSVIASPVGRGNPVGDVMWDAGTMRGLPYAVAGLPRRGFAPPRNDKEGSGERGGMVPLDCRVATLLAMTSGGTGMGGVLRVTVFGRIPPALSLRAR